jgi:hypothetical protein
MAALKDLISTAGLAEDGKFLVLKSVGDRPQYFREWVFRVKQPGAFVWTPIVSLARGYLIRDYELVSSMQRFIRLQVQIETDTFLVEGTRLVRFCNPQPHNPLRSLNSSVRVVGIEENKKRGDWFQGR